jgi:hypothetical protein
MAGAYEYPLKTARVNEDVELSFIYYNARELIVGYEAIVLSGARKRGSVSMINAKKTVKHLELN